MGATVAAAVLSLALGAAAVAATPTPGTLGLSLTPAPVHVDDVRTFVATNLSGGLALAVTLTAEPASYAVEPASFTLAPDASQTVTVTAVDPGADGRLHATATSDAPGQVRSQIALDTRFIHTSGGILGAVSRAVGQAPGVALALAVLAAFGLAFLAGYVLRRRRAV